MNALMCMLKNKQTKMSLVPAVKQKRHIELETFLFFKPFSASASDKAGKGGATRRRGELRKLALLRIPCTTSPRGPMDKASVS